MLSLAIASYPEVWIKKGKGRHLIALSLPAPILSWDSGHTHMALWGTRPGHIWWPVTTQYRPNPHKHVREVITEWANTGGMDKHRGSAATYPCLLYHGPSGSTTI